MVSCDSSGKPGFPFTSLFLKPEIILLLFCRGRKYGCACLAEEILPFANGLSSHPLDLSGKGGGPGKALEEDRGAEFALSRAGVFLELALHCLQGSGSPEPACSLQGTLAASPTHLALLCLALPSSLPPLIPSLHQLLGSICTRVCYTTAPG